MVPRPLWLVVAIVCAGCSSSVHALAATTTTVPSSPSTIVAQATISGTLERIGGPPGPPLPLPGQVSVTGAGRTYVVAAEQDGHYSISVPAGRYTVTGRSPLYQSGTIGCVAQSPITVTAGRSIKVDVVCPVK